jgi:hypothetical protein
MNRYPCRCIPLLLGIAIACSAAGQSPLPEATAQEHLHIDVERKQADASFEIQHPERRTQFLIVSCTQDAQMRRIEVMASLKRR